MRTKERKSLCRVALLGQHQRLAIRLHEPNRTIKKLVGLQDTVEHIKSVELVVVH
jgi:hypothetical protein